MWPKNENQEYITKLGKSIADRIKITASKHDRAGTFPHEHFEFMRENGYLRAAIPVKNGGGGHGLTDIVLAQYEIGCGDGSTAVSVGMHQMIIGAEIEGKKWPAQLRERVFNEIAKKGALINSVASESDLGSPRGGGRPQTTLVPVNRGNWILNGRKIWSTLSPGLSYAIIFAAVEDGTGDIGRVIQSMDSNGISIEEPGDSMCMRASGSHDIVFKDVNVSEEDFIFRANSANKTKPVVSGDAWFPLLLSASNLGIANAARCYAIDFAINRKPSGATNPISKIPFVREQIARIESKLLIAKRSLFSCAEDWETYPNQRQDMLTEVSVIKIRSIDTAIEVTDLAMRVAGAVGLDRNRPLERYFRDARSGIANPPIEARALEQVAAQILD